MRKGIETGGPPRKVEQAGLAIEVVKKTPRDLEGVVMGTDNIGQVAVGSFAADLAEAGNVLEGVFFQVSFMGQ